MPTRFSTGSTAQYPECYAYKMATEKLLHIVNLYGEFMVAVKVNLRQLDTNKQPKSLLYLLHF